MVDRNYQEMLYARNREQWDIKAKDAPNASKDLGRYIKLKKSKFSKNYQIMEMVVNLKI